MRFLLLAHIASHCLEASGVSHEVICHVPCSHCAVDPWLQFVFWLIVWRFVEGGVPVCVVAAFFVLVGVVVVVLSRSSPCSLSGSRVRRGSPACFFVVCIIILIIRRCVEQRQHDEITTDTNKTKNTAT